MSLKPPSFKVSKRVLIARTHAMNNDLGLLKIPAGNNSKSLVSKVRNRAWFYQNHPFK